MRDNEDSLVKNNRFSKPVISRFLRRAKSVLPVSPTIWVFVKKSILLVLALAVLVLFSSCKPNGSSVEFVDSKIDSQHQIFAHSISLEERISELQVHNDNWRVEIAEISPEVAAIYTPVLECWQEAISENFGYSANSSHINTYPYVLMPLPNEMGLAHYAFYDIDGNGIPELFIAAYFDFGYYFLADVYTIKDNSPVRLFEGIENRGFWTRNKLNFTKDGKGFFVHGSNGASHSISDYYRVSENGYQVELIEGFATYNPNDSYDLRPHYRLPDGSYQCAPENDMEFINDMINKHEDMGYFYKYGSRIPSVFYQQLNWQLIVE